jgi:L-alanine-DL-glutamate epimerase-like enolase superfamily enzyme
VTRVALWEKLRGLDLVVEQADTERQSFDVSSEFTRVTTTIVLTGRGEEGRGEDVTYTSTDHDWFPKLEPAGNSTLGGFSAELDGVRLFEGEPQMEAAADYRRWAFESAALDLALRQAGMSLGVALDREYRPVRFVVSTRADAFAWLEHNAELELKLDPEPSWERALMERLAETGLVRVLDFKAYYQGTPVDVVPDPKLYRAAVELFPDAVIEDAWLEGECGEVLAGKEARLSFDAPVHSLADLRALPVEPGWLNVKPSRFGTLERLLECIQHCEATGIRMYGGGQFELGVGRSHIQALASLFYPDGPNDVAPKEYNLGDPRPGLPRSPLPTPERLGL